MRYYGGVVVMLHERPLPNLMKAYLFHRIATSHGWNSKPLVKDEKTPWRRAFLEGVFVYSFITTL